MTPEDEPAWIALVVNSISEAGLATLVAPRFMIIFDISARSESWDAKMHEGCEDMVADGMKAVSRMRSIFLLNWIDDTLANPPGCKILSRRSGG